jgi:hypothetical protein
MHICTTYVTRLVRAWSTALASTSPLFKKVSPLFQKRHLCFFKNVNIAAVRLRVQAASSDASLLKGLRFS